MRRAAFPLLLGLLVLAGCASRPDGWYRAGSSPDDAATDERRCRNEATQIARQRSRLDANIAADRAAGDYAGGAGGLARSQLNISRSDQLATEERENIRDLVRSCMADRGYRLLRD